MDRARLTPAIVTGSDDLVLCAKIAGKHEEFLDSRMTVAGIMSTSLHADQRGVIPPAGVLVKQPMHKIPGAMACHTSSSVRAISNPPWLKRIPGTRGLWLTLSQQLLTQPLRRLRRHRLSDKSRQRP